MECWVAKFGMIGSRIMAKQVGGAVICSSRGKGRKRRIRK
jgi:hypothetical protein